MAINTAFALGLITSGLQTIFVMLSWILTSYLGRRTIYLWGSAFNVVLLIALGIAASVGVSVAASNAQASLGLIISVLFTLGPAPASWVIIGETSSIRLRPLRPESDVLRTTSLRFLLSSCLVICSTRRYDSSPSESCGDNC